MRERLLAVGGGSLLPFRFLSRSASPTEKKFLLARGFCCAEAAQGAQPPCEGARLVWTKVETKFRPYRASYSSAVPPSGTYVCMRPVRRGEHMPIPSLSSSTTSDSSPSALPPPHTLVYIPWIVDRLHAGYHTRSPTAHTYTRTHTHTLTAASANGSGSRVYCYWRQVQRRDTREEQQSAECTIKADFCGAFLSSAVQPAERAQRAQHSLTAPGLPSKESISRRRGAEQCRK